MLGMEHIIELVRLIAVGVVGERNLVGVAHEESSDETGELTRVIVTVGGKNAGALIGVEGATAQAIRKVVGLVGFNAIGRRVHVKIDAVR